MRKLVLSLLAALVLMLPVLTGPAAEEYYGFMGSAQGVVL